MSPVLSKRRNGLMPYFTDNAWEANRFFSPSVLDFDKLLGFEDSFSIPEMNVIENEKNFKVELAAPGMDRKDFNIEVRDGVLNISAQKEKEKHEDKKNYRRREFSYTSFERSFALPDDVSTDDIDAKYENGILKLTLPKNESAIVKTVKHIKVS